MYVETIATTMIDEVEYQLSHNDPGRETESYGVRVTRRDDVGTNEGQFAGTIIGGFHSPDHVLAQQVYELLTAVALTARMKVPSCSR
jgi:hypothetical protein